MRLEIAYINPKFVFILFVSLYFIITGDQFKDLITFEPSANSKKQCLNPLCTVQIKVEAKMHVTFLFVQKFEEGIKVRLYS